jgi:hypothetical protein
MRISSTKSIVIIAYISVIFTLPIIFTTILPILLVPYSCVATIFTVIYRKLPDGINLILTMFSSYLVFVIIMGLIALPAILRAFKSPRTKLL